jgi:hypothetical protein
MPFFARGKISNEWPLGLWLNASRTSRSIAETGSLPRSERYGISGQEGAIGPWCHFAQIAAPRMRRQQLEQLHGVLARHPLAPGQPDLASRHA